MKDPYVSHWKLTLKNGETCTHVLAKVGDKLHDCPHYSSAKEFENTRDAVEFVKHLYDCPHYSTVKEFENTRDACEFVKELLNRDIVEPAKKIKLAELYRTYKLVYIEI